MNESNTENIGDEVELIVKSFDEIEIGQLFNFMDEPYKKLSRLRAVNILREFDWMFPLDTQVNV